MFNSLRLSRNDISLAQRPAIEPLPWGRRGAEWPRPRRIVGALVALILVAAGTAPPLNSAPQTEEQTWALGDYVAYANAVRTDFLAPEVADKLNIDRSNEKALITVSVQEPGRPAPAGSVEAEVSVTATRSAETVEDIEMREHRADDAIYYLGVLPVRDREPVRFDFAIAPAPSDQTYRFGFERFFFTD